MLIEKKATKINNEYLEYKYFSSARNALFRILESLAAEGTYTLFLPMYIGYSPKEGSGIYDPVCRLRIPHVFYPFNENLEVDISCLEDLLCKVSGNKVFLFVHYFGYVDPSYKQLIYMLRQHNVMIIEDYAHAFYTHLVDGKCGEGDCGFYSFHKMLPFPDGGAAVTSNPESIWWKQVVSEQEPYPFYHYNLKKIADKRKKNAECWEQRLESDERIKILRTQTDYKNQTAQSFPILLKGADRFRVYTQMNDLGFGTISLYHTMIDPIQHLNNVNTLRISRSILNLPVHQDIGEEEIQSMYEALTEIIQKNM